VKRRGRTVAIGVTVKRWIIPALGAVGLISLLVFGDDGVLSRDLSAMAQGVAPVTISSEVLGHATPAAIDNPELSLGRVTIMPGAEVPMHYHPGTQIGVVVQGTLTYTVFTGQVVLYRAGDSSAPPQPIQPGETVQVGPGDALVEPPVSHHQGRNDGKVPIVIYYPRCFPRALRARLS
jgi:mannose-6-phosphate isomerase-like protein (cupin superfamily)